MQPKNVVLLGGGGHVIFDLHLGVGYSVLREMEGVGHAFSNHHISKCSVRPPPPPPVRFDQCKCLKVFLRFFGIVILSCDVSCGGGGKGFLVFTNLNFPD